MIPFREQLRYEYPLTPSSIVLDCGGYEGSFCKQIVARYGCNVHVFEPIKEFYQNCVQNLSGLPKVEVHNYGLGGETRPQRFFRKGCMSGAYCTDDNPSEVVMVSNLADVLKALRVEVADLFKINCEGGEFELLEAVFRDGLVRIFRNIQCQFHAVLPDAIERRLAIRERLSETHHLTYDEPFVWENWEINCP